MNANTGPFPTILLLGGALYLIGAFVLHFTPFGRSARPVAAMAAPYRLAISGRISGSGKALAYAIARQESEFNIGAVSSAGARGLLQLMPGTAKQLAKKAGLQFSLKIPVDPQSQGDLLPIDIVGDIGGSAQFRDPIEHPRFRRAWR